MDTNSQLEEALLHLIEQNLLFTVISQIKLLGYALFLSLEY